MPMKDARVIAVSVSEKKGTKKKNVDSVELKKDFGIVGDAHAGGKIRQVSLLAEESIEKMKAKGLKVRAGDFAENITTEGIDLIGLEVGDKLRLGKEALVEISQKGKECHTRCNIYYQAGDCVMPTEGVFGKVLSGGEVRPGDKIELSGTYSVAVLTISDKCSRGQRVDESGKIVQGLISGLPGKVVKYEIVPDEPEMIKAKLKDYADNLKVDLVLTDGGTGFTERDRTPEATMQVIEKLVPGIPEAMRFLLFKSSPRAMLSRGIAGIRGKTLIVNLPGSSKGAKESLEAVLATLPHGLDMILGKEH